MLSIFYLIAGYFAIQAGFVGVYGICWQCKKDNEDVYLCLIRQHNINKTFGTKIGKTWKLIKKHEIHMDNWDKKLKVLKRLIYITSFTCLRF
jgi:hypothetical protein